MPRCAPPYGLTSRSAALWLLTGTMACGLLVFSRDGPVSIRDYVHRAHATNIVPALSRHGRVLRSAQQRDIDETARTQIQPSSMPNSMDKNSLTWGLLISGLLAVTLMIRLCQFANLASATGLASATNGPRNPRHRDNEASGYFAPPPTGLTARQDCKTMTSSPLDVTAPCATRRKLGRSRAAGNWTPPSVAPAQLGTISDSPLKRLAAIANASQSSRRSLHSSGTVNGSSASTARVGPSSRRSPRRRKASPDRSSSWWRARRRTVWPST